MDSEMVPLKNDLFFCLNWRMLWTNTLIRAHVLILILRFGVDINVYEIEFRVLNLLNITQ